MLLTVLTENTTRDERLIAEHGLSLYIESSGRRLLFDFGQTDAFSRNADALQVDLTAVDTAVLSHGHYDHGGGMHRFLEQNTTAPVLVSRHAFGEHYNGSDKYIGLDPSLSQHPRLRAVDDRADIGDGMTILGAAACPPEWPINAYGLTRNIAGAFNDDPFLHEQCLCIREHGKTILISGCSHRGVLNWIQAIRPDVFIGGFHFMKLDPNGDGFDTLAHAADTLAAFPCQYYTGHCTGDPAFAFLKGCLGDRLQPLYTGVTYRIV